MKNFKAGKGHNQLLGLGRALGLKAGPKTEGGDPVGSSLVMHELAEGSGKGDGEKWMESRDI